MKIFYDYQPDEVINKVNLLLKKHGLWFEDDGEEHDGYILYKLLEFKVEDDNPL